MNSIVSRVLAALWAVLSVGVLIQFAVDSGGGAEIEERMVYSLLALDFPASLIMTIVPLSLPLSWLGLSYPIELWCTASMLGFVQWFVALPALVRWVRRRLRKRTEVRS